MSKSKVQRLQVTDGREILVTAESTTEEVTFLRGGTPQTVKASGQNPVLIGAKVRPASSAPTGTRVKVAFTMDVLGQQVVLPLQQATLPATMPGFTGELRLEMN